MTLKNFYHTFSLKSMLKMLIVGIVKEIIIMVGSETGSVTFY
jgi:hypothetical protein